MLLLCAALLAGTPGCTEKVIRRRGWSPEQFKEYGEPPTSQSTKKQTAIDDLQDLFGDGNTRR